MIELNGNYAERVVWSAMNIFHFKIIIIILNDSFQSWADMKFLK